MPSISNSELLKKNKNTIPQSFKMPPRAHLHDFLENNSLVKVS